MQYIFWWFVKIFVDLVVYKKILGFFVPLYLLAQNTRRMGRKGKKGMWGEGA